MQTFNDTKQITISFKRSVSFRHLVLEIIEGFDDVAIIDSGENYVRFIAPRERDYTQLITTIAEKSNLDVTSRYRISDKDFVAKFSEKSSDVYGTDMDHNLASRFG